MRLKRPDPSNERLRNGGLLRSIAEMSSISAVEFGPRSVEEKQTDFKSRGFEIIIELAGGQRRQERARFGFDDDTLVNQHVEPLPGQVFAVVLNSHGDFACHPVVSLEQLSFQRCDINRLQKAIAKSVIRSEEGSEDRVSSLFLHQSPDASNAHPTE